METIGRRYRYWEYSNQKLLRELQRLWRRRALYCLKQFYTLSNLTAYLVFKTTAFVIRLLAISLGSRRVVLKVSETRTCELHEIHEGLYRAEAMNPFLRQ